MSKEQELELVEDDEQLDILDPIIDIVSIGSGVITGAGVSYCLNEVIPAARTTVETVMRTVGIGSAGVTAQWLTSSAIANDAKDIKELFKALHGLAGSAGNKLLGGDNDE